MYTFVPLKIVAIVLGVLLIVTRLPGVFYPERVRKLLLAIPRSKTAGYIFMGLAAVWCGAVVYLTGFMEFVTPQDWRVLPVTAGIFLLIVWLLDDFLAVRGLAILWLLMARVMLDAAFVEDTPARLVVTVMAYVMVVAAMVFTISPYRLRDVLEVSLANKGRCRALCAVGVGFGVLLLALGIWVY